MRETVAAYSAGTNQVIFEGSVEKQELKSGSPGAPSGALSMTGFGSHRAVTLNVLRAYRGNASGKVIVLTGLGGGDCGFDFETGKQYVVYASRVNTEILFTSICSGTSSLETRAQRCDFFAVNRQLPMTFWTRKATIKNLGRNNMAPLAAGLPGRMEVRWAKHPST